MRTQRHSIKGYTINYSTNTIIMNYKFAKSAQDYGSAEYQLLTKIKADFPTMKVSVIAGRKIDTTNIKKRLTYKNIAECISAYANADELLENFEQVKLLSKPLASPYKYVCDWFYSQFPEYQDSNKSLLNTKLLVKLVDLPDESKYKRKESYEA